MAPDSCFEHSVDEFLSTLDLTKWHYIGLALSCVAFASDFFAMAAEGGFPTGLRILLNLIGAGCVLPLAVRYVMVYARLPKSHPLRNSAQLTVIGFARAAIPSRAMRRQSPWLLPVLGLSLVLFLLGFLAAFVSYHWGSTTAPSEMRHVRHERSVVPAGASPAPARVVPAGVDAPIGLT